MEIRATGDDRVWLTDMFVENWSSTKVVTRGILHELLELPSYVAFSNGKPAGALVFRLQGASIVIVSLRSRETVALGRRSFAIWKAGPGQTGVPGSGSSQRTTTDRR